MPKAHDVAEALRTLANSLDAEPEEEITAPLCFFYPETSDALKTLVRLLPHPLNKFADGDDEFSKVGVEVGNGSKEPVWISASTYRRDTCERVQISTRREPARVIPAHEEIAVPEREVPVYAWHCPSFLQPAEEEESLEKESEGA